MVYKIVCEKCKVDPNKKVEYIVESARTPFDRGAEHLSALRRLQEDRPLADHHITHHKEEEEPNFFMMKAIRFEQSPLVRQALEGAMIAKYKGDLILNKKEE